MSRAVSRRMEGDVQEDRAITRVERTGTERWKKPKQGKLKMNYDIATGEGNKVGLEFVVRDHEGNVRLAGKKIIEVEGNTTLLEGLALLCGFQMCRQYNIQADEAKSDNKNIIECLKGAKRSGAYVDVTMEDIQKIPQQMVV